MVSLYLTHTGMGELRKGTLQILASGSKHCYSAVKYKDEEPRPNDLNQVLVLSSVP